MMIESGLVKNILLLTILDVYLIRWTERRVTESFKDILDIFDAKN